LLVVKLRWEGGRFTLIWDERSSVGGKRVRGTVVDPGDGHVAKAETTFELTSLTEVYGGLVPSAPLTVHQISGFAQGFVAGQTTEAIYNEAAARWECLPLPRKSLASIFEDNNGFNYVVADQLAGAGLAVEVGTGPAKTDGTGNVDRLKVLAPPTEEGATTVLIKEYVSHEVSIDTAGTLSVKINWRNVYVTGTVGSTGNTTETVDVWDKAEPGNTSVVTSVACVDDEVTGTNTDIKSSPAVVLIPPTG
jgi:hypothetical protein